MSKDSMGDCAVDKIIEAAMRSSIRSILTHLKPGVAFEDTCHILCWLPSDQLLPLLDVVREYHRDRAPPVVAIQDKEATLDLFQPAYCKVDWKFFDPHELAWRFDGEAYLERLEGLSRGAADGPRARRSRAIVPRLPLRSVTAYPLGRPQCEA